MERPVGIKIKRVVNTVYTKWPESEKQKLIEITIKFDNLFTGKNANQRDGWIKVSQEINIPTQICRQQWQAIMRKYKTLCDGHSGDGTNEDGPALDANTWPFFDQINNYAAHKHNYNPEGTISNLEGRQTSVQRELYSSAISTPSSPNTSPLPQNTPSTSRSSSSTDNSANMSLFEIKIYKNMSKKIGPMMSVLGQMVKHDYPSIDVSQLLVQSDSSDD